MKLSPSKALRRVVLVSVSALLAVGLMACGEDETPRSNTQDTTQTNDQSDTSIQCEAPEALCGADCVDLFNDPENCGDCGIACHRSELCVQGQCGLICPDSQLACSDVCVTPASNPLHCGRCDEVCASNEYCSQGQCITPCEVDETLCGTACARLNIDPEHCGGCDLRCDLPFAAAGCLDSTCFPAICYRDYDDCDRAPSNGCEMDLLINPKHCGACNVACAAEQVCAEGACAESCPDPLEPCNGGCVPPGSCGATCEDPLSACGTDCVDLQGSLDHCGVCDNPCQGVCDGGECNPAPAPVSGLSVVPGDQKNLLSWAELPADIRRVTIRRSVTAHPTSLDEGDEVCDFCLSPYEDKDLTNNTTYFYAVWAIDRFEQASTPALAQGTPSLWLAATLTYLKPSVAAASNSFGERIVLSADGLTLAVGVPDEDSASPGINGDPANTAAPGAGAVYVFSFVGGVWSQEAYIKASNPDAEDHFGYAISLSADGNTLAVGANQEDSADAAVNGDQTNNAAFNAGAAYVFVRDANRVWSQEAYLKASNANASDSFGSSVAFFANTDTLAVGAPGEASAMAGDPANNNAPGAGAVYIFNRTAGTWSQEICLKASVAGTNDNFGLSLSFSGINTILAIGAPGEASASADPSNNDAANAGAVYVFIKDGIWSQDAFIKASAPSTDDRFGASLSLNNNGDLLAVGAPNADANAGTAYVFRRAGVWAEEASLKAQNTDSGDNFGASVLLSGPSTTPLLVVGAPSESSNATGIGGDPADNSSIASGAIYAFAYLNSSWTPSAYIKAPNADPNDRFGQSVALSSSALSLCIGAPGEASNATGINGDPANNDTPNAGAVYELRLP